MGQWVRGVRWAVLSSDFTNFDSIWDIFSGIIPKFLVLSFLGEGGTACTKRSGRGAARRAG